MMSSKTPFGIEVGRRVFFRVTFSTELENDDDENGNAGGHESGYTI